MDKNTIEYLNRYNDKITFTLIDENTIKMEGGEYIRMGWNNEEDYKNKKYSMIDPSGGPYISKNYNMGHFNKNWNMKLVDYITPENDYYLIKTKNHEIR